MKKRHIKRLGRAKTKKPDGEKNDIRTRVRTNKRSFWGTYMAEGINPKEGVL